MKNLLHLFLLFFLSVSSIYSQIKSGPMLGPVELRTAFVWCEVLPESKVKLEYWKKGDSIRPFSIDGHDIHKFDFQIYEFYLTALDPGTTYEYQLVINSNERPGKAHGELTTQQLWNHRKPAPDFSFLTGSCAYFNQSIYDRPGKPYGGDSSIFESMAKEHAAFMLWLGDNWYYREVDYGSEWGLWYRASRDRSNPVLQNFLKSMSHYAIWDDHDFGPNNFGAAYVFKLEAKNIFNSYWSNPAKNNEKEGIYTQFNYNDVDFFMMDDRTFRSSDELKDSIDGLPNPQKIMWGAQQMRWLEDQLANSEAPFKIIVNGSPVLNGYNKYDCLVHFANEFNELIHFITEQKIQGVLFFTGDRHHSEITGRKLSDSYTTYDIVSSSLTSGISKVSAHEKKNPDLIANSLVEENNYTRVRITGSHKYRTLKIEFMDVKGNKIKDWEINENQLKFEK